ncbi:long-chain fatty acid--CoA ligase [Pseudonocardia hispaniensis]|uniref:Long-chain fatty acid--CoA ligase n=1 Tax=Pseudonocardia hispaniensis TaxID=904933 RepID=A0ABW1J0X7_9PSEU
MEATFGMDGLMMDQPLLVKRLLWRAEHVFGTAEVVTRVPDGYDHCTYAGVAHRVRRLAGALRGLGVAPGDRVATLAWNTRHHLEAYFAVPGIGAVLHTANHRLSPPQLAYTINHAGDRAVLVDPDLVPLLEAISDELTTVRDVIVLGPLPAGTTLRSVHSYEELLAAAEPIDELPEFDETTAAALCYTSGTTGDPKGVVYSHRSTVLHALVLCAKDSVEVSVHERFLLATPMSHVNAWGMPYACVLQGATLLLPGVHPTPDDLVQIVHDQRPTTAVGAVTVGSLMREAWQRSGGARRLDSLRRLWLGGQAPPAAETAWWARTNATIVVNGWGMTELSPLGTFCSVATTPEELADPAILERQSRQGPPLPLVEMRIVDETGTELPWDGESVGELEVRAPWAASGYFRDPRTVGSHRDGWLRTGDVSVFHPDGSMHVKDRCKDLIKSGGEWISSVELENALMAHPSVREAVVVAVPDPTWVERPLACVETHVDVPAEELLAHLAARFPRFWVPDRVVFVRQIPKTSVGKFDKKRIRAELAAGALDSH